MVAGPTGTGLRTSMPTITQQDFRIYYVSDDGERHPLPYPFHDGNPMFAWDLPDGVEQSSYIFEMKTRYRVDRSDGQHKCAYYNSRTIGSTDTRHRCFFGSQTSSLSEVWNGSCEVRLRVIDKSGNVFCTHHPSDTACYDFEEDVDQHGNVVPNPQHLLWDRKMDGCYFVFDANFTRIGSMAHDAVNTDPSVASAMTLVFTTVHDADNDAAPGTDALRYIVQFSGTPLFGEAGGASPLEVLRVPGSESDATINVTVGFPSRDGTARPSASAVPLENGRIYYFRCCATDGVDRSEWSDVCALRMTPNSPPRVSIDWIRTPDEYKYDHDDLAGTYTKEHEVHKVLGFHVEDEDDRTVSVSVRLEYSGYVPVMSSSSLVSSSSLSSSVQAVMKNPLFAVATGSSSVEAEFVFDPHELGIHPLWYDGRQTEGILAPPMITIYVTASDGIGEDTESGRFQSFNGIFQPSNEPGKYLWLNGDIRWRLAYPYMPEEAVRVGVSPDVMIPDPYDSSSMLKAGGHGDKTDYVSFLSGKYAPRGTMDRITADAAELMLPWKYELDSSDSSTSPYRKVVELPSSNEFLSYCPMCGDPSPLRVKIWHDGVIYDHAFPEPPPDPMAVQPQSSDWGTVAFPDGYHGEHFEICLVCDAEPEHVFRMGVRYGEHLCYTGRMSCRTLLSAYWHGYDYMNSPARKDPLRDHLRLYSSGDVDIMNEQWRISEHRWRSDDAEEKYKLHRLSDDSMSVYYKMGFLEDGRLLSLDPREDVPDYGILHAPAVMRQYTARYFDGTRLTADLQKDYMTVPAYDSSSSLTDGEKEMFYLLRQTPWGYRLKIDPEFADGTSPIPAERGYTGGAGTGSTIYYEPICLADGDAVVVDGGHRVFMRMSVTVRMHFGNQDSSGRKCMRFVRGENDAYSLLVNGTVACAGSVMDNALHAGEQVIDLAFPYTVSVYDGLKMYRLNSGLSQEVEAFLGKLYGAVFDVPAGLFATASNFMDGSNPELANGSVLSYGENFLSFKLYGKMSMEGMPGVAVNGVEFLRCDGSCYSMFGLAMPCSLSQSLSIRYPYVIRRGVLADQHAADFDNGLASSLDEIGVEKEHGGQAYFYYMRTVDAYKYDCEEVPIDNAVEDNFNWIDPSYHQNGEPLFTCDPDTVDANGYHFRYSPAEYARTGRIYVRTRRLVMCNPFPHPDYGYRDWTLEPASEEGRWRRVKALGMRGIPAVVSSVLERLPDGSCEYRTAYFDPDGTILSHEPEKSQDDLLPGEEMAYIPLPDKDGDKVWRDALSPKTCVVYEYIDVKYAMTKNPMCEAMGLPPLDHCHPGRLIGSMAYMPKVIGIYSMGGYMLSPEQRALSDDGEPYEKEWTDEDGTTSVITLGNNWLPKSIDNVFTVDPSDDSSATLHVLERRGAGHEMTTKVIQHTFRRFEELWGSLLDRNERNVVFQFTVDQFAPVFQTGMAFPGKHGWQSERTFERYFQIDTDDIYATRSIPPENSVVHDIHQDPYADYRLRGRISTQRHIVSDRTMEKVDGSYDLCPWLDYRLRGRVAGTAAIYFSGYPRGEHPAYAERPEPPYPYDRQWRITGNYDTQREPTTPAKGYIYVQDEWNLYNRLHWQGQVRGEYVALYYQPDGSDEMLNLRTSRSVPVNAGTFLQSDWTVRYVDRYGAVRDYDGGEYYLPNLWLIPLGDGMDYRDASDLLDTDCMLDMLGLSQASPGWETHGVFWIEYFVENDRYDGETSHQYIYRVDGSNVPMAYGTGKSVTVNETAVSPAVVTAVSYDPWTGVVTVRFRIDDSLGRLYDITGMKYAVFNDYDVEEMAPAEEDFSYPGGEDDETRGLSIVSGRLLDLESNHGMLEVTHEITFSLADLGAAFPAEGGVLLLMLEADLAVNRLGLTLPEFTVRMWANEFLKPAEEEIQSLQGHTTRWRWDDDSGQWTYLSEEDAVMTLGGIQQTQAEMDRIDQMFQESYDHGAKYAQPDADAYESWLHDSGEWDRFYYGVYDGESSSSPSAFTAYLDSFGDESAEMKAGFYAMVEEMRGGEDTSITMRRFVDAWLAENGLEGDFASWYGKHRLDLIRADRSAHEEDFGAWYQSHADGVESGSVDLARIRREYARTRISQLNAYYSGVVTPPESSSSYQEVIDDTEEDEEPSSSSAEPSSSSSEDAAGYVVSGAGSHVANGEYLPAGSGYVDDAGIRQTMYTNGACMMSYDSRMGWWWISTEAHWHGALYASMLSPTDGWSVVYGGESPSPTVEESAPIQWQSMDEDDSSSYSGASDPTDAYTDDEILRFICRNRDEYMKYLSFLASCRDMDGNRVWSDKDTRFEERCWEMLSRHGVETDGYCVNADGSSGSSYVPPEGWVSSPLSDQYEATLEGDSDPAMLRNRGKASARGEWMSSNSEGGMSMAKRYSGLSSTLGDMRARLDESLRIRSRVETEHRIRLMRQGYFCNGFVGNQPFATDGATVNTCFRWRVESRQYEGSLEGNMESGDDGWRERYDVYLRFQMDFLDTFDSQPGGLPLRDVMWIGNERILMGIRDADSEARTTIQQEAMQPEDGNYQPEYTIAPDVNGSYASETHQSGRLQHQASFGLPRSLMPGNQSSPLYGTDVVPEAWRRAWRDEDESSSSEYEKDPIDFKSAYFYRVAPYNLLNRPAYEEMTGEITSVSGTALTLDLRYPAGMVDESRGVKVYGGTAGSRAWKPERQTRGYPDYYNWARTNAYAKMYEWVDVDTSDSQGGVGNIRHGIGSGTVQFPTDRPRLYTEEEVRTGGARPFTMTVDGSVGDIWYQMLRMYDGTFQRDSSLDTANELEVYTHLVEGDMIVQRAVIYRDSGHLWHGYLIVLGPNGPSKDYYIHFGSTAYSTIDDLIRAYSEGAAISYSTYTGIMATLTSGGSDTRWTWSYIDDNIGNFDTRWIPPGNRLKPCVVRLDDGQRLLFAHKASTSYSYREAAGGPMNTTDGCVITMSRGFSAEIFCEEMEAPNRYDHIPLSDFVPGAVSFENPCVVRDGAVWRMYFNAIVLDKHGIRSRQMWSMTTTDFDSWYGAERCVFSGDVPSEPHVRIESGSYEMYAVLDEDGSSSSSLTESTPVYDTGRVIMRWTGSDGIAWTLDSGFAPVTGYSPCVAVMTGTGETRMFYSQDYGLHMVVNGVRHYDFHGSTIYSLDMATRVTRVEMGEYDPMESFDTLDCGYCNPWVFEDVSEGMRVSRMYCNRMEFPVAWARGKDEETTSKVWMRTLFATGNSGGCRPEGMYLMEPEIQEFYLDRFTWGDSPVAYAGPSPAGTVTIPLDVQYPAYRVYARPAQDTVECISQAEWIWHGNVSDTEAMLDPERTAVAYDPSDYPPSRYLEEQSLMGEYEAWRSASSSSSAVDANPYFPENDEYDMTLFLKETDRYPQYLWWAMRGPGIYRYLGWGIVKDYRWSGDYADASSSSSSSVE